MTEGRRWYIPRAQMARRSTFPVPRLPLLMKRWRHGQERLRLCRANVSDNGAVSERITAAVFQDVRIDWSEVIELVR